MMYYIRPTSLILGITFLFAGCVEEPDGPSAEEEALLAAEAEIGMVSSPDSAADSFNHFGGTDYSEICKPIPNLDQLNDPEILVSVNGLTFHLWDNQGTYDRVFRVGLGMIKSGRSLTPLTGSSYFHAQTNLTAVIDGSTSATRKWAWNYSCRIWSGSRYYNPLTDQEEYASYFAGLPFIRFEGPYGIHGPIDNYWEEDGGILNRGYVSGGCVRMDADDLVEVFALLQGSRVPMKVQTEVERDASGLSVDPHRFVGAECRVREDCADTNAECVENPNIGRSFCRVACTTDEECPKIELGIAENELFGDRSLEGGDHLSHCMVNHEDSSVGQCLIPATEVFNNNCARYEGSFRRERLPLFDNPSEYLDVCAPALTPLECNPGPGLEGDCCWSDDAVMGECINVDTTDCGTTPITHKCPRGAGNILCCVD